MLLSSSQLCDYFTATMSGVEYEVGLVFIM